MQNKRLRERREAEFYRRVLAAIEKPSKSKFSAVVNSGLFLWLLSAILITCGGAYITNIHQCLLNSDQLSDNLQMLSHEILLQRSNLFDQISSASTLQDIRTAVQSPPKFTYIKYKDRTMIELINDLEKLDAQVDRSHIPEKWRNYEPYKVQSIEFGLILFGDIPSEYTDKDVAPIRKSAMEARSYDFGTLGYRRFWTLAPKCGLFDIVTSLFTTQRYNAIATMPESKSADN